MNQNYGGVIWTDHALQRLTERGIKQSDAYGTFISPQESRYAVAKGAWVYYKDFGSDRLEVVATKNEQGQWVILSVWSKPIFQKTRKQYKPSRLETRGVDLFVEKILQKLLGRFKK